MSHAKHPVAVQYRGKTQILLVPVTEQNARNKFLLSLFGNIVLITRAYCSIGLRFKISYCFTRVS